MNIRLSSFFSKMRDFLRDGVWNVKREDTTAVGFLLCNVLRVVLLTWQAFTAKRVMAQASALTYSTLLAIVPIAAVIFGIAKGFGVSKTIETWLRDTFSSQPQVAETLIEFVNSYLVHAKGGVILGVGFVIMVYTVVLLTSNIETTFNDIWNTKNSRSFIRMLFDYVAFIFLIPIFIVVSSGISIFMATMSKGLSVYLAPIVKTLLTVTPYVIMSLIFVLFYIFMPNTRVRFRSALVPGIFAGVCMQILQFVYIHSQIWVSSYNAIYGSFAALPLFMLWLQISWTIVLLGALLCYTNQNHEDLAFLTHSVTVSHRHKLMLCAVMLSIITKRFEKDSKPLTELKIKQIMQLPSRLATNLLNEMKEDGLLVEVVTNEKTTSAAYVPATDINHLTVGKMVDRLEAAGPWRLDTPMHKFFSPKWKEVLEAREMYLKRLNEILLHEL